MNSSTAAASGKRPPRWLAPLPMARHQPADGSPAATVAMTSTRCAGCTAAPPSSVGAASENSPDSTRASATGRARERCCSVMLSVTRGRSARPVGAAQADRSAVRSATGVRRESVVMPPTIATRRFPDRFHRTASLGRRRRRTGKRLETLIADDRCPNTDQRKHQCPPTPPEPSRSASPSPPPSRSQRAAATQRATRPRTRRRPSVARAPPRCRARAPRPPPHRHRPAQRLPEGQVLSVTTMDNMFMGPSSLSAGLTTVQLHNQGPAPHQLQLLRLRDGVSADQAIAAAKTGNPGALLSLRHGGRRSQRRRRRPRPAGHRRPARRHLPGGLLRPRSRRRQPRRQGHGLGAHRVGSPPAGGATDRHRHRQASATSSSPSPHRSTATARCR